MPKEVAIITSESYDVKNLSSPLYSKGARFLRKNLQVRKKHFDSYAAEK